MNVTDIPSIMRSLGWSTAARLLSSWFAGPSNTDKSKATPRVDIVKMNWALGFQRAKDVYDASEADKVWINDAAKQAIIAMLRRHNKFQADAVTRFHLDNATGSNPTSFTTQNATTIDQDSVQFRTVTETIPTLDDLTGALGNFSFKYLVAGTVTPADGGHVVKVELVGVYIRDNFDFEGSQRLGCWSKEPPRVSLLPAIVGEIYVPHRTFRAGDIVRGSIVDELPLGLGSRLANAVDSVVPAVRVPVDVRVVVKRTECVDNETFRDWRSDTGKGEDYYLFSDIKHISTSDEFFVPT